MPILLKNVKNAIRPADLRPEPLFVKEERGQTVEGENQPQLETGSLPLQAAFTLIDG